MVPTGHGSSQQVVLYDGFCNMEWSSPQSGTQPRTVAADTAPVFGVSQYIANPTDQFNGFMLFTNVFSYTPFWFFSTGGVPAGPIDMSVNPIATMHLVGAAGNQLYLWSFHAPPPFDQPFYEWTVPLSGIISDVSISYSGNQFVVGDNTGCVYLFDASGPPQQNMWCKT